MTDTKDQPTLQIGQVVEGKYKVVRLLGEGGMGAVYEVRHTKIGRRLALKMLHPRCAESPELVERFIREAQAAAAIGSEHIVDVTDAGETDEGAPFIVMEFLEGRDLNELLLREGALEPTRAVGLALQLCAGLEAAHRQGIIHRDLKPANLMVTHRSDGSEWIKVLDFGVAKIRESLPTMGGGPSPELTGTSVTLGTPYYMAPEQVRGSKRASAQSDIYAAGVVLYELLTGRRPFQADTYNELIILIVTERPPPPRELRPSLDPGLEAVILRAMSREPEARPGSMAELAEDLRPFASEQAPAPLGTTAPAAPGAKLRERAAAGPDEALAATDFATDDGDRPATSERSPGSNDEGEEALEEPLDEEALDEEALDEEAPAPRWVSWPLLVGTIVVVALLGLSAAHYLQRPPEGGPGGITVEADGGAKLPADSSLARIDEGAALGEGGVDGAIDAEVDAEVDCPPGAVRNEDTRGHCCWPAQVWSKTQGECIGEADCQGGMSWRGGACACPEGQAITVDTRERCCWPGQAWSVAQERCLGPPRCPNGFRRAGAEACEPDEATAIGRLTRGCQQTQMSACVALGEAYLGGGVAEQAHALLLFRQGCEGSAPRGCLMWARSLDALRGGDARAQALARGALLTACDGREAEACTELGAVFEEGRGVTRDLRRAAALFTKGCTGRHLPSCVALGVLLDDDRGPGADLSKAAELFERACAEGEAEGCARLANAFDLGRGVKQDPQRAAVNARTACDAGQAQGCRLLGRLHRRGRGVAQDDLLAARYAEKACQGGLAEGCRDLGLLHQKGLGVRQDHGEAARLYRKACDGGDAFGCRNLAIRYRRGEGVEQDHGQAAAFFLRACQAGDARGCSLAADQYVKGEGVTPNKARGRELFKQGCDGGDSWACEQLR